MFNLGDKVEIELNNYDTVIGDVISYNEDNGWMRVRDDDDGEIFAGWDDQAQLVLN